MELNPNSTVQLSVEFDPWYCTGIELEWESSNTDVLTVDGNGLVTTHKKGTAFVTVRAKGYDRMSRTLRVQVVDEFYVVNYTLMRYYGGPDVVIPDDLNVLYIDEDAFRGNTDIRSVTISKTVAEIDEYAFENCVNLESVTIPSECTLIRERAFAGCVNLKTLNLLQFQDKVDETHYDTGTLTLGRYAFYNCRSLTDIVNPQRIMTVRDHAFAGCTSLSSLDLTGLRVSDEYVFENCTLLGSVTMDADTAVAPYMFAGCTSLEEIEYFGTTVPDGMFYNCTAAFLRHAARRTDVHRGERVCRHGRHFADAARRATFRSARTPLPHAAYHADAVGGNGDRYGLFNAVCRLAPPLRRSSSRQVTPGTRRKAAYCTTRPRPSWFCCRLPSATSRCPTRSRASAPAPLPDAGTSGRSICPA